MTSQTLHNRRSVDHVDIAPLNPPDRDPLAFHRRWPGYAETPLCDLPEVAAALGVGRVYAKVETERLGLPSYKVLGASWAIYRTIIDQLGVHVGSWRTIDELRTALADSTDLSLVAATDGNHGRAVARVARLLGWKAHILVPTGTAQARLDGILEEGASLEVTRGSYDDAVTAAAALGSPQALVISDTAWPGYVDVPSRIIEGYSTLFWEVDDAIERNALPIVTHAVAQIGVGSLAAALVRRYRTGIDDTVVRLIGVEPIDADCALKSIAAGKTIEVPGPHRSIMAGLNCGLPSPLALPLLTQGLDALVAVDDEWAKRAMRLLAAGGVVAGESGAAGVAGLLALRGSEQHRSLCDALQLDKNSVLLTVITEGATDPTSYRAIVRDSTTP